MFKLLYYVMAPCLNHFNFMQTTFFVCLLAALLIPATGSLLNHDEECFALYHFKQSIPHQDYASFGAHALRKFDSWKMITSNASESGSDCCLWDGVVCSYKEEDGHVIGLDLSESFLYGPINSSSTLFNLVYLQALNLSMNNFTESQIPSRIANLKQLRILDLSDAEFSGQIPNEISQLVRLSSLDLSGNPLKLQSPSLDDLVKNLTGLEELHLSGVDISSSLPRFLANFSSLRSIKLRDCFLQNEFPTAILQLPKLEFLDVALNTNLTGTFPEFRKDSLLKQLDLTLTGFFGIVPESVSNLNHLTFLHLTSCSFTGNIPGSLSNMTQLVDLGLGDNQFTGLIPSLVSLLELNYLDLGYNKFEKGRLPDWLVKLSKLNELYVPGMSLYSEIPPFLANLTKLTVLDMTANSLFGRIPSSFFNLTQLTIVELGTNQLHGPISNSFSNFKSLQTLVLFGNNFSGRVELDMFLGLEKLVDLTLGYNRISFVATHNYTNGTLPELTHLDLSSCNLKEYPAFLRFHNKMITIFLSDNNIHGLMPEWTWNRNKETLEMLVLAGNFITGFHYQHQHVLPWVRLRLLMISYNQIQGRLPIPPPTTYYYYAKNNNLSGEIPLLICEVKSLLVLDLSLNNMSGTLPPCFASLSNSLVVLDLHNNNFQGTMMNKFTQGSQLKRVDLTENHFVGLVSKSLINCTNLEFLSLADNSFNDVFPSWLGTLFELQVLILRSNKFYGPIQGPTMVSPQFLKLRIIDLSNNGFSGQLPDKYFETWNAMKPASIEKSNVMESVLIAGSITMITRYSMTITVKGVKRDYKKILNIFTAIDLSCNNFEGEIPESLQDLHGLESLNLSNNHLTGRILSSLGNLKNLESLDLSQNKLSGEIPQQLLQLDFLSNFNVSFNRLDGHIPQANHFDTFDNSSYMGNLGLCGKPLSKECQNSKPASIASQTSNKSESFLPSERVDWIVIFFGVGSGLVVGIVIGNFLYTRYSDCLIERFGMRNGKWIRTLSNMRKN